METSSMWDYKTFLLNEQSRSQLVTWRNLLAWIDKNATEWKDSVIKHGTAPNIYRGTDNEWNNVDIISTDPTQSQRLSRGLDRIYLMIMSYHKSWSKYAKRDRSLICATDSHIADAFGTIRYVIPPDNAKICVAPAIDMFYCFTGTDQNISDWLNEIINKLLIHTDLTIRKRFAAMTTYKDLENISADIDSYNLNNIWDLIFNNPKKPSKEIRELFKRSFLDGMIAVFEPKDFVIYKPKKFYNILNKNMNNEIWFDSEAMLIKPSMMEDLIEYYKKTQL